MSCVVNGASLCMSDNVNNNPYHTTVWTKGGLPNMWLRSTTVGISTPLDLMTYEQVYEILIRVPKAKEQLYEITDDPCLIALANSSKLITPEHEEHEAVGKLFNKNSLPFYTLMRGNIDGSIY